MTNAILPPDYTETKAPVIFLAGPIQGAYGWQDAAIQLFAQHAPDLLIANPRRPKRFKGDFGQKLYNEQVDWETYHLRRAGEYGVVLFWLAKEMEHTCERAYAQTTRFEISEWKMRHEYEGARLVVGIEEGFTGAKYLVRRFGQDCPDVPLCNTLEETVGHAIRLAHEQPSFD